VTIRNHCLFQTL